VFKFWLPNPKQASFKATVGGGVRPRPTKPGSDSLRVGVRVPEYTKIGVRFFLKSVFNLFPKGAREGWVSPDPPEGVKNLKRSCGTQAGP